MSPPYLGRNFLSRYSKLLCFRRFISSQVAQGKAIKVVPIEKLLIANRGEIACRIVRTARKLGVRTVGVYSDADRQALHVNMVDEAVHIGPPSASQSYLNQQKIIQVAKETGAQAIHPGYGFLSENTEFAELCQREGVIFVGPPASAIRDMGIKSASKVIMSSAGVPVIQGYHGENQDISKLKEEAERIGYPVMIKAVRGGGGKGMRICRSAEEFEEQLESAKREAQKAVGDDVMLIEKFVENPRHVEVQVFGDIYGNYVYLYERDCSVQRRHQKVIEEAPAPGLSEDVRHSIGQSAVKAARAVNYVGAGTVEFILDKDHKFYFMEMNTRLQVEHPVTEMITGTDLVEWQIKVASGEPLPLRQEEIIRRGHSFEARVYAENPNDNFLPGAGPLFYLNTPSSGSDTRIETGVRQGDEVSVHYDPMIAKLVVWSEDRTTALQKLRSKLSEYNIVGVSTNVDFLMTLASHPRFVAGDVHTDFIPQHYKELFPEKSLDSRLWAQAALALVSHQHQMKKEQTYSSLDSKSPFGVANSSRLNHHYTRKVPFSSGNNKCEVIVTSLSDGKYKVQVNGDTHKASVSLVRYPNFTELVCDLDGHVTKSRLVFHGNNVHLFNDSGHHEFVVPLPKFLQAREGGSAEGDAVAPMPGVIEKIMVQDGQQVEKGQPVIVIIAMKMEYVIRAPRAGVVEKVLHKVGDNVPKNALLVKFREDSSG